MSQLSKPPEPRVVTILREYRQVLDAKELLLMDVMAKHWLIIEQRLEADTFALAAEFARRAEAGEVITQQMVWRAERYKIFKAQMDDQIKRFNRDYAAAAIADAQHENALLGLSAAQDAIKASYFGIDATGPMFNRLNIGAVEAMIGFAGDGSPLRILLAKDYPEAVDGLLDALINGLARGLGPGQIARDMADGMGMGLDRSLLIARTEAARAYRTASTEQYRQSGVTTGFMRLVKKETACAACLFLDGERFESEDELYDHPRGKCDVICVVEGVSPPEWEKGQDWFAEQSPEEQQLILGPERYQLWKDGQFKLSDLARKTHNDIWGGSPHVATVAELVQ